jgi:hypothetical protein
MSQHLAEPKFPKNKICQYKCVSDPYRLKQLGGVEEMVMSILSQLTQLAELAHSDQPSQEGTHYGISALSKPYALGLLTAE